MVCARLTALQKGLQLPNIAVIVLAAGQGTRMKSATPKVLHTVGGRTMVEHALRAGEGITPDYLVAVIGHGRDQVQQVLDGLDFSTPVSLVVQTEQKGTGHAVQVGLSAIPDDFHGTVVVTTGDTPLLDAATLAGLVSSGATVATFTTENPTGYGRIVTRTDATGAVTVTGIVEEKDATAEQKLITEVNSGVYAFDADFLRQAVTTLTTDNAQGELYLTDVVAQVEQATAFHIDDPFLVAGVNDRVQLAALNKEFYRRQAEYWMREGVTIEDPATTFIEAGVTLGRDVTIHPNTQLKGATTIGEGAEIGPDTTLENMTVGAGAWVNRVFGKDSEIGEGADIGPFTYIRPGVVVGKDGKLGGFVEAKNAQIGEGSKVPHLSYIGDATVGDFSNIGASSVFANYDGVNKHHTTIGSYVRTGSDTMFVAPVNVGDGVYSGAGTVIREDVPAGSLVVSGGKQRNIEGWVIENRPDTAAAKAAKAALEQQK